MTSAEFDAQLPDGLRDQDLLDDALKRGLFTPDELESCRSERLREARHDEYQPIWYFLVRAGFLTRLQLGRLIEDHRAAARIEEIPGYQLLKRLGQGATGAVFLAQQKSLQRLVALKILSRRLARNYQSVEALRREARTVAKLDSRHWPNIYEIGCVRGQYFVSMEYVDGQSLESLIKALGRIPIERALRIASEAAAALEHLHQLGLVHRDIKPQNVVVSRQGQLKIIDLGLCRAIDDTERADAERGTAIGTPLYISPEQATGEVLIDHRADLYCLGATLYHMICGQPPFPPTAPHELFEAHRSKMPRAPSKIVPDLPPEIDQLVMRLLAKRPGERWPSAHMFRQQIRELLLQWGAAADSLAEVLPT